MSYLTINAADEKRAMKIIVSISGDAYLDEADIRDDLHAVLKAATGHDEIKVAQ